MTKKLDDEKDSNQSGESSKSDDKEKESKGEPDSYAKGTKSDDKPKLLKAITDDSFTQKTEELLDSANKGYRYGKIPQPNLKDGALISFKTFLKDMNDYRIKQRQYNDIAKYDAYLDKEYKKFMNENKKTVMYLVKEFEMKKSAQAIKEQVKIKLVLLTL